MKCLDQSITNSPLVETITCTPEAERSQVEFMLVSDAKPVYHKNGHDTRLSVKREPLWGITDTVNLSGHHLYTVFITEEWISDVVVEAFLAIAENSDPDIHKRYAGFEDPGVLVQLRESGEAIQRIKGAVSGECSRTCAQPLYAAGHFVTAVKRPESDAIIVYNSLDGCPPEFLLLQIHVILGDGENDLNVELPRTAKQGLSDNVCAVMASAFAADIFTGDCPNNVQYVDESAQRLWLLYCLQHKQLVACPRIDSRSFRKKGRVP